MVDIQWQRAKRNISFNFVLVLSCVWGNESGSFKETSDLFQLYHYKKTLLVST